MNIKGYDVTMKNVWAYIQGNTRKITNNLGTDILKSPQHIQEQIIWREVIHNPECYKAGQCLLPAGKPCKCKVPDKFYSDKACDGGCYPQIMDKYMWFRFKQLAARRDIDIYNDKFDWDVLLADIDTMGNMEFSSLIGSNQSIQDRGKIQEGTELTGHFKLFNPFESNLVVNSFSVSCNCCKVNPIDPVQSNSYFNLNYTIDTTDKVVGGHEIWITFRYNDIERMSLQVKFEI